MRTRSVKVATGASLQLAVTDSEHDCAVRLIYMVGLSAPVVIAKGRGKAATTIVTRALGEEVPVIEDDILAGNIFWNSGMGEEIDEESYNDVAGVFVDSLDVRRVISRFVSFHHATPYNRKVLAREAKRVVFSQCYRDSHYRA